MIQVFEFKKYDYDGTINKINNFLTFKKVILFKGW